MKHTEFTLPEKIFVQIDLLLDEAMEIKNAKCGAVQILNPITKDLQLILQKGFEETFIEPFMKLSPTCNTVCARTYRNARNIMIADIAVDCFFKESIESGIVHPFKALHCSPIMSSEDEVIGILNTHFDNNLHLSDSEIKAKEKIAEKIAVLIEPALSAFHEIYSTIPVLSTADNNESATAFHQST